MENKFKKGDKVKCLVDYMYIKKGDKAIVFDAFPNGLINLENYPIFPNGNFQSDFFELVTPAQEPMELEKSDKLWLQDKIRKDFDDEPMCFASKADQKPYCKFLIQLSVKLGLSEDFINELKSDYRSEFKEEI